jgi:hypothetical protein
MEVATETEIWSMSRVTEASTETISCHSYQFRLKLVQKMENSLLDEKFRTLGFFVTYGRPNVGQLNHNYP